MQLSLEQAATAPLASHQLASYMIPEKPQLSAPDFFGDTTQGIMQCS
jgi:hypothetical protein